MFPLIEKYRGPERTRTILRARLVCREMRPLLLTLACLAVLGAFALIVWLQVRP